MKTLSRLLVQDTYSFFSPCPGTFRTKQEEIDINDPKAKPETVTIHNRNCPLTSDEMDKNRKYNKEYEYLCFMAQARDWVSRITGKEMTTNQEFKKEIQKGEIFIKLISTILDQEIVLFESSKLKYKHSDNHNISYKI